VVRERARDRHREARVYLASVLDMGSRRVLGFALGEHHHTTLAYSTLAMAVAVRRPGAHERVIRQAKGERPSRGADRGA
jgi:hypothetical protein